MSGVIQRLVLRATLEDPDRELERAREAAGLGDESWERWLRDYERGTAVIARAEVRAQYECEGRASVVATELTGIWLESSVHPPELEAQLQEIAPGAFIELERALCAAGAAEPDVDLSGMLVHVEVDADLRRRATLALRDDPPTASR